MKVVGWGLFGFGVIILFITGVIGYNGGPFVDNIRVGNFPGMLIGSASMISGSIFVGVGQLSDLLADNHKDLKVIIGVPIDKIQPIQKVGGQWVFGGETYSSENDAEDARNAYISVYGRES